MYKLYYIIYKNNKLSGYVKIHNYIYTIANAILCHPLELLNPPVLLKNQINCR